MEGNIVLKAKAKVTKVCKKTKAKGFQNLKVGDVMEFGTKLERSGRNKGTYATYIYCENKRTDDIGHHSFNQISSYIECFEWEQLG